MKAVAPILLIGWNRPALLSDLISLVTSISYSSIFISLDGLPSKSHPYYPDVVDCHNLAKETLRQHPWIRLRILDSNVGCAIAVSSAISWFFSHVDSGIIIEDDIKPSDQLFPFFSELLELYKDDYRVFSITADNKLDHRTNSSSYHFSKYPHCWGWATWSDRWSQYRLSPSFGYVCKLMFSNNNKLQPAYSLNLIDYIFLLLLFLRSIAPPVTTWDWQMSLLALATRSVTITPSYRLADNLGTQNSATHHFAYDPHTFFPGPPRYPNLFPIKSPAFVVEYAASYLDLSRSYSFRRPVLPYLFYLILKYSLLLILSYLPSALKSKVNS